MIIYRLTSAKKKSWLGSHGPSIIHLHVHERNFSVLFVCVTVVRVTEVYVTVDVEV